GLPIAPRHRHRHYQVLALVAWYSRRRPGALSAESGRARPGPGRQVPQAPAQRPAGQRRRSRASSRPCSPTPRTSGRAVFAGQRPGATEEPKLVLFSRRTPHRPAASASRRWARSTARRTSKVYIDLGFFDDLQRPLRRAAATSPRPTSSPTRSATTCRTCSASREQGRTACAAARRRGADATRCRCGWNCRPTAWPASGRTTRRPARARSSSRATSRRRLNAAAQHRRRPHAAPGRRATCVPGRLHPRQLGAARALVQARAGESAR
ncbi:MAG: neutral zinc metallopeptidase, partial [Comamonadaceae bacterium]|nr:neutral zinc metallopeptidase [Comamonadaceae bacterium]